MKYSYYSSYFSYYSYYYFFFLYSNTPSGLHQTTRVARPRVGGAAVAQVDDAADVLSTYNKESGGGGGARPRVEVRAKGVRHRRRAEARGRAELGEGFTQPYRL